MGKKEKKEKEKKGKEEKKEEEEKEKIFLWTGPTEGTRGPRGPKNTIRDGGSTALCAVYTNDPVDTVYTIQTALSA